MKRFLKVLESVFVYYFASFWAGVLSVVLFLTLILLIVDVNRELLSFTLGMLGTVPTMFWLFYKDGYRRKRFELKYILISLVLLYAFVWLLVLIIGRAIYITGPTDFFAHWLFLKLQPDMYYFKDPIRDVLDTRYCVAMMSIAFVGVYSPTVILAEFFGVKKYKKEYEKLVPNLK